MKGLANKMLRGSSWVFVSRLVDGIIALLFSIIIANELGVDNYGFIGATMGVVGLISILTHMGLPHATTKYVSESLAKKDIPQLRGFIRASLYLELVLGTLLAVVLFLSADLLAQNVFNKPEMGFYLKLMSPMILFAAISNTFMSTLVGYHKMREFAVINICNFFVRLGAAVFLVMQGYGVAGALLGFVIGWFAGSVLSVIYYLVKIRPHIKNVPPADTKIQSKKMLAFGIPMAVSVASILIYGSVDKLMLTAFSSDIAPVSIYAIAFGMVALPLIISRSLNTSFFPIVSALHAENRIKKLRETYESIVRLTMYLLNPILVGMIVLSPQIILLLYKPEFIGAVYPFIILALWGFFGPTYTFAGSVMAGTGNPRANAKVDGFTAALNVCLNLGLIPLAISINHAYGPIGAAVATTSSYIVGMSVLVHLANKRIKAKLPMRHISKSIGAALLSGIVMYIVMYGLWLPGLFSGKIGLLITLLVSFFLGICLYIVLLSALRAFKDEDVDIIRNLNIPMKDRIIRIVLRLKR
jgi:stage V sporulation protein B